MVRVDLGDHASGTFTVRYAGTALQAVGRAVSLASAIAFAGVLLYGRKRRAAVAGGDGIQPEA